MKKRIKIFDTTLRDGEQSPGASMNIDEKVRVAHQLEKLNVDIIEAGFPIASEGDFEAVKKVAETIKSCHVAGLARANNKDIDRAWEALKGAKHPRIHTFIATSDIHLKYKLKKSRDQVLEAAVAAVKHAKSYTDNVEFSAEDAVRSDVDYLCKVVEAVIDAGATTVNIPDTVGYAIPTEFGKLIKTLHERVPNVDKAVISVHCHNDLGLAVANSLAAIENGAGQVECTINGIGERAGNASLEEIVMAIRTRSDLLGFETGIDTSNLYPASRLITHITGMVVQPNKAIVGANAFAHEAGIHQDGVLKEKSTYEIMTPESVGVSQNLLVLGKHSGRHAFRERIKDLGYELDDENLDKAFSRFKNLADKKKEIFDEDLDAIIADEVIRIDEKYKLAYLNVSSGTVTVPTATVQMEMNGDKIQEAGFGVGPVDAVYETIAKITKTKSKLIRYSVSSVTRGMDAQGEVTVRVEEGGKTVIGQGAHTDIIVASAKAYINALNKLEYRKKKVWTDLP
ncbi:MAG: 2-isopropylmalate synthase [Deltaproteobacteria bacterium]|nr:2-isopropylmalate synthase [Deltaproteobacteria bacterium]